MVLYVFCMFRLLEWIFSDNDVVPIDIEEFNYKTRHFISSFRDHVIQIYVGQKPGENQWRPGNGFRRVSSHCITVLSEQYRNINVVVVLEQYLVFVKKNNVVTYVQLVIVSA